MSVPSDAPSDSGTGADTSTNGMDGGDAAVVQDAASGFCSSASGSVVICDDFDTDPLSQGWVITKTGGATVQLTASDKSLPYAFQASVPSSDGGAPANAFMTRSLPVPMDFDAFKLAFDLRVAERDNPGAPKELARLTVGNEGLVLSSGADNLTLDPLLNGEPSGNAQPVSAPSGIWMHIELGVARTDGGTLAVTALRDGAPLLTAPVQLPVPGVTQFWTLNLGAANASTNGACRFVYENVLVTSE